jgi:formate dehydrogenase (coenzyme F420) beta subunit
MKQLIDKATQLLAAGTVKAVIGYGEGTARRVRPLFARTPADADKLVYDERCLSNLAVYLPRRETKKLGPVAVVAAAKALRSILQLFAERQLRQGEVIALAVGPDGISELGTAEAIEQHVAMQPSAMRAEDKAAIDRLMAMSVAERRAYWEAELGRCIKCYACRSSCPMCYCERCTMDCNRPQWVPAASHALGNFEYHMVRAMHLAGRCVECGTCGQSCPVDIPVHLLTFYAEESVRRQFGQRGGASATLDYAMSTFRPDDKESFIR